MIEDLRPARFYSEEQQFKEIAESINSNEMIDDDRTEPTREQSVTGDYQSADGGTVRETININSAGVSELSNLPGIGPVLANRIHTYIEDNGPFRSKEDIILVKGIGEKLYSRIQDLVTIE
ncbi:MAG: helix-hairpin-helix domain-containing protein [Candidatus Marinimicrobia bacterium]|nr:helix-hairpin-helix domain-containing protein [Candidatus Neomarinimicrobiota bacterium]MCF7851013.1 helix-hairpin-helix domain-containing protein [Candidatus Neomarinimicrobiota bacterium]MCF7904933.1 helix-hairpin-helix domain-containing protein [Candidatus Neomarinimicrobiota bacterium]